MKIGRKIVFLQIALTLTTITLLSCNKKEDYSYYYMSLENNHSQLEFLFETLIKEDSPESRYILIIQISNILKTNKKEIALNTFLLEQINSFPKDPFNGYYLNIIANYYNKHEMPNMAELYYKRIVRNHPDIEASNESIKLIALKNLTKSYNSSPEIIYYSKLVLKEYKAKVQPAKIWYKMIKSYETLGLWEEAMNARKNFLSSPPSDMQGEYNLRKIARSILRYYEYEDKNWGYNNLNTLAANIKRGIRYRNDRQIKKCMSKVNFFALSWAQEATETNPAFLASLGSFIKRPIVFKATIEKNPNDQEAYWETTNWHHRIRTWQLYFRRINFPADPSIHGKWEWAGIYFGEKPFISTD